MDNIELKSLVPEFLEFYKKAEREGIDSEQRWKLWKEYYNFAAVPPGKEGEKLARVLLDESWDKYSQKINYISNWTLPHYQEVDQYLTKIKTLLGCEQPINLVLIYFVGAFDNNPFVAPYDEGRLALCLPIETEVSDITLPHELTHIVHSRTASLKVEWERTIASLILQEGLATQVSKYIIPGKEDKYYIEHKDGWFESCNSKRNDILKGILPYLEDSTSESLFKFTFGMGTTDTEREAYFAGWEIVNGLLEEGVTFREIASVQEDEMPDYLLEKYPMLLN
ncbi:hypothetical protein JNUCC1_02685 [Lentibacillus sp. JNUCC-1]|uniref:hypothetical protein n=1 Tax=Lentibacillus sp. JNUCC-1 TaxID=2654513 RepID=UPI0012E9385C|nr:hypothetical protein [Lentibacillus sp. JNUCC-1]MUV38814.1 hypothetical protein [Lentibacillus sp. JNUCC-1]